ncbi:MAG: hypothetical protein LC789_01455 [Actinobacteria bacterium]|nr:hypothetical protein [Actinomycetota bacterium]
MALLLAGPGAAYADDPVPAPVPSAEESGCADDPLICQSGGAPMQTPVDCGLPTDEGVAVGEPVDPAAPAADTPTATIGTDPGVICIASGVGPQGSPTGGGAAPEAAPGQLPRTGPAPLLETVAIGSWLLLLGVLGVIAGRRTART